MAQSPLSTPKRKLSQMPNHGTPTLDTTTQFSFRPGPAPDDGSASPRARVAQRFQGLTLGCGGGGSGGGKTTDLSTIDDNMDNLSQKRPRIYDVEVTDADTPTAATDLVELAASPLLPSAETASTYVTEGHDSPSRQLFPPQFIHFALDDAVVEQSETVANTGADLDGDSSTPSPPPPSRSSRKRNPNRRSIKLQYRSRHPQPAVAARANNKPAAGADGSQPLMAEPLPVSLTWHEDEITIYDPDDPDDDGTGINGIGFKPTPAVAYARAVHRRRQLAEYRQREEREARARRSQRRMGVGSPARATLEPAGVGKHGKKPERRKVRFLESAAELIAA